MVQYCCVPHCKKTQNKDNVSFHSFPSSKKLKKTWIQRLKIGKPVTNTMRVCSCHFCEDDYFVMEGVKNYSPRLKKGVVPSKNLPRSSVHKSPNKDLMLQRAKRKDRRDAAKANSEAKKKLEENLRVAEEQLAEEKRNAEKRAEEKHLMEKLAEEERLSEERRCMEMQDDTLADMQDTSSLAESCKHFEATVHQQQSQITDLQDRIDHFQLKEKDYQAKTTEIEQLNMTVTQLKRKMLLKDVKLAAMQKSNRLLQQRIFTIENFKNDEDQLKYYTGLPSYNVFIGLLHFLIPGGDSSVCINYDHVSANYLPLEDQLFFVLVKLRHNLGYGDLQHRFAKSKAGLCRLFKTWINYMYLRFGSLSIWPHRNVLIQNSPADFIAEFPNVMIIVDGTEIFVEKSTDLRLQSQTYSSYKSRNTLKGLVGVDQRGGIIFISQLMDGSISDKELCKSSGLLDVIKCKIADEELLATDEVMADKGFTIRDILQDSGMNLVIPPFALSVEQMSDVDVQATKNIARYRVHVERAMKRIKKYKILTDIVPLCMIGSMNQIWTVVCFLANLEAPLHSK